MTVALLLQRRKPSPQAGGRRDDIEGARSGIHPGFTAVSLAGPGARRPVPDEYWDHASSRSALSPGPSGEHVRYGCWSGKRRTVTTAGEAHDRRAGLPHRAELRA